MGAKDLLRQSHMTGKVQVPEKKEPKEENVEMELPTKEETVEPKKTKPKKQTPSSGMYQVKRDDVDLAEYGVKPDITNFQLYNYELSEFLTSFSKQNKKHGGNPITKSQLMETILGFAFYDMELKPEGFENPQDLLAHLQEKIKK
ncbi:hypothetical protein [Virgibacillus salexigens]|uniref:Uncharacterized protein n=1 Tax=Virgibacillus massiliensis TaxID=1462526 RepID=A0A024QJ08_9BACI|nr:hypothetical protein [Virgibacillus massiliensis]CDQ41931.1 hypothetical protein BN990_04310 [Virgibacillus massiliensis]